MRKSYIEEDPLLDPQLEPHCGGAAPAAGLICENIPVILWALCPQATECDFQVAGIDPNTGMALSKLDGKLYSPTNFIDPETFIFRAKYRFAAPFQDIFYQWIDETLMPDGKYAVTYTPVGGTGLRGAYDVRIAGGVEQFAPAIPGISTNLPTTNIVTGREMAPGGIGVSGVKICARITLPAGATAVSTPYGSFSGEACTYSGRDGTWALPLIPETTYGPGASYTFTKILPGQGTQTFPGVLTGDTGGALDQLLIASNIAALQVNQPTLFPELPAPTSGYCKVTGRAVDVSGKPMANLPVQFGTTDPMLQMWAIANSGGVAEAGVEPLVMLESTATTYTPPETVATQAVAANSPQKTVTLPAGAILISVTDGRGFALSSPSAFSYDRTAWIVTFTTPFYGVIKYKLPSTGRFAAYLMSGREYWIQLGKTGTRRTFVIPPGVSAFDVSRLDRPR